MGIFNRWIIIFPSYFRCYGKVRRSRWKWRKLLHASCLLSHITLKIFCFHGYTHVTRIPIYAVTVCANSDEVFHFFFFFFSSFLHFISNSPKAGFQHGGELMMTWTYLIISVFLVVCDQSEFALHCAWSGVGVVIGGGWSSRASDWFALWVIDHTGGLGQQLQSSGVLRARFVCSRAW